MAYSLDLRHRVVGFVRAGGSKAEASRRFSVNRGTVYDWLSRDDLSPVPYVRQRGIKLDRQALRQHVTNHPHMLAKDRAAHFGVHPSNMCRALKQIGMTRKKSN